MGSQRVIHNSATKQQQSEYLSFFKIRNRCQLLSNTLSTSMKITTFSPYMVTELGIIDRLSMHVHYNIANIHIEIFFYFWSKSTLALMYLSFSIFLDSNC